MTDLNREGLKAPKGGKWNASTLNGSRQRANGILSNSLYIGKLRFDRQAFRKDPKTGKRQARPNAQADWVEREIPDLRIIHDELWEAAQAKRATHARTSSFGRNARRPKRVLSGLLRCGVCGESYVIHTKDFVGCSGHRNKGTCDNSRIMSMGEIELRVLKSLQTHLLSPELAEAAVEAYRLERQAQDKKLAKDRRGLERELADVKVGQRVR